MKRSILFVALLACLTWPACTQKQAPAEEMTFSEPNPFNPPRYVCYRAPGPITVDGKLSPGEWDAIPWTDPFADIEGAKRPAPLYQTKAKMAHSEQGMYFAVWIEEPHVWATITRHDAVIFQDNDFEIFIDPSNNTHNYLEYEVNALGTVWDLFVSKPYRDGAVVLNNWEFAGMESAVHVDGSLNNPSDTDRGWSVEVFIPWRSIYQMVGRKEKPDEGEQIRVNFSRVEWTTEVQKGNTYVKIPIPGEEKIREYNWVWAPSGIINIHLPEYWGYVQFSNTVAGAGETAFAYNPDEEAKWMLRRLYYRQNEYANKHGHYSADLANLKPEEICTDAALANKLELYTTPSTYEIVLPFGAKEWHIKEDGLVWEGRLKKE